MFILRDFKRIFIIVMMLSGLNVVEAADYQSVDDIEQAAYLFSLETLQARYDNPQVIVEPMDRRLKLKSCATELAVSSDLSNNGLGNQTVVVKCNLPQAWTVYVPIKVKVMSTIAVLTKALDARHVIRPEDVRLELRDIASIRRGYFDDISKVIGMQLKYSVSMGTVLHPSTLLEQKIVRRGDLITLVAVIGQMEVRMSGKALADGYQGQRVRVKNSSSKRIVEGVVEGPGIVKVIM